MLTKKIGAQLSFEKLEFGMFPPSTVFKKVSLKKSENNKYDADIKLNDFGVSFTYSSFFSSNLEIDELYLGGGSVSLKLNHDDKPILWEKLKLKELFNQYLEIYSKSPLKFNIIKIENIEAKIDNNMFNVKSISFFPHKKNIRLKADVENILISTDLKNINIPKIASFKALLNLEKDDWKVDELFINDGQSELSLNGKLYQTKEENRADLILKINSNLKLINTYWINNISDLKTLEGKILANLAIKGNIFSPNLDLKGEVESLKTPFANLENISFNISKQRNILSILDFKGINKNETYKLLKPTNVFDISKMNFLKTRAFLSVENAFTNTFLYVIRKSLDVAKGYVTGKIEVAFDGEKVFFVINEKAQLKNFKLILPGSTKPLLQNDGFDIENTIISLDSKDNVGIDAKITMPDSMLHVNGIIDPKNINLITTESKINLKSFGPISGIKISGSGPIDLKIFGPMDDVRFDFNANWKKFGLLDLNFGDVKSHFVLSLSDVMLSIENLEGKFNNSNFTSNGWLKFGDKSGLDIKFNFPDTSYEDAKQMYALVFNGMKIPKDLSLKFESNYRVYGDYDLENLKIDGTLKGRELHVLGEDADSAFFNFSLNNKNLNLKNMKIKKGRGEVTGTANISLLNNYTEIEGNGAGIRLSDFNFYKKFKLDYDSDLNLEFEGNGTSDTFSSRIKFKTIDPFIGSFPASNSNGLIYLNHDDLVAKINLFSGKVKLDTIYEFNNSEVYLKSQIETSDLKELFGAVSAHNMNDKQISGQIKANLNTKFNSETFSVSKFLLDVKQFKLKRNDVDLRIDPNRNMISVENGVVKKWDILFKDGNEFFSSKAKSIQDGKSIIGEQSFSIKSNILELINGLIEKSKGIIKGSNQIILDKRISFNDFKISSQDASLKFKNIPGLVTGLNYEVIKNGNRFEISKFVGKFGDGEFHAGGFLLFEGLYPTINIDFKIERSIIPLFKKSNIVISGSGIFSGSDLPYKFTGKASLLHGEILDDPAEIMNEGQISLEEFNKYLPTKNDKANNGYLNLNIGFDTQNYVVVKNNMAEIYLKAQGQVTGNVQSPEINAKIDALPTTSKFKFKGHDFILSQGSVEIHDKEKTRNSDLKFIGTTKINDYEIKLDLSGKLDKVAINLSSDPAKSLEDIVSLLTLGVTSDMNKSLDPNDRSSIAKLGIGTIFLDRLKVNEDLNSSIGVNLSVLPEFQEDESSLISGGKTGVGENTTSKLKSATKIKISKPLTSKIDVSVSSTVGGSIEQKQEMNINWNVNKTMSLQGIYEIKASEEDSNANTSTNSLGADLKFKWPF